MIGLSSIMDLLLEEQRFVIKFLVAEGEKPCHIFQRLKKRFSEKCVSCSTFYNWVSQFQA
jgi:transposase